MAKRKYPQPICDICSRFMSWDDCADSVVYTPFGSWGDTEPPDERLMHKKCWTKLNLRDRRVIDNIAWIKPCRRNCCGIGNIECN